MRILTAGESHGEYESVIIEGFPKGVKINLGLINSELKRRMSGFGRGKRMAIENDTASIVSGIRAGESLGSPITILVKNKDAKIFSQKNDKLSKLTVPRPSHADLTGALKYGDIDVRNMLERSSARETVARVCAGSICKQFLKTFDVAIASFTVGVGSVCDNTKPKNVSDIIRMTKKSLINCLDKKREKIMVEEIKTAEKNKDTLGGISEIWLENVPFGIGSFMHYDRRLDAKLAGYLMGIPAVKGVEIGLGFDYARQFGSKAHDSIYYSKSAERGFYRKTNNSGGIEGGMSNGEVIVARIAMKPIATLPRPLESVDLKNNKPHSAIVERSDTCAIVACGVIGESMAAIAVVESFLEKFGCDSLEEITDNYKSYLLRARNLS